jgi:hypothetical protein
MTEPQSTGYGDSPDTTDPDGTVTGTGTEPDATDATLTTDEEAQRNDSVERPGNEPD